MAGSEEPLRAVPSGTDLELESPSETIKDDFAEPDSLLIGAITAPQRQRAEKLKAAYTRMLVAVRESAARSDSLASEAAELEMTLEETKGEVSPTATASSEDDEDEVDEFVVQLDRAYSELDSAKVRRVELDSLLVDLDVQRSEQGEKLIAVESVEPTEEEEAIRACKEAMRICGNELVKQQDEIAELKRHVVRLEEVKGEAEGERDESYEQRSKLYAELTREEAQTSRVASLAEHQVEPMVVTLRSELAGAEGRSNRLEGDADAIKVALVDAEVSSVDLNKQLARVHRTHTRELAQETQLKNDLVRLQEVEIGLQAERVELTSKMTLTKGDARALLTSMMTVDREKEKGLQKLKATQFRMVKVQQNLQALTAINDDRTLQIKHIKRSIKNMSGKIETTADERSRMETSLMTNKATKEAELKAYRTVLQNRDAADRSVAAARKESYELERARKKAERSMDQADADATQAHEDARQAELDFADVKSTMTEARERLNRLEAAENDVKDLYQAMKNEKNKFASQTTALAQRVADMNDKFKMLANEMEILRASALERKVGFTLLESKIMEEHRIREKILTEESDCRARNKELRDSKRAHNADTKLLFDRIDASEVALSELSARRVKMHQEKNDLASRYSLKMEELRVVYSKLDFISGMIRQGDVQLTQRESDHRFHSLEASNLERALQLLRSRQPVKEGIERELIKTRLELFRIQKTVAKKEKLLEKSGGRTTREVMAWKQPSDEELYDKVKMLSNRLAEREARELELDLVLQETLRLESRVSKQTEGRRTHTVMSTRSVNEAQAKLAELTRKTMAIVSELSMYQGTCIKQQQHVNELRLQHEENKIRFDRGDAPSEEVHKEWEREHRRIEQVELSKQMASLGISPGNTAGHGTELPDGTITFANQRPAAYIPTVVGAMPKSKAFGANAPFKPAAPSSNLKFFLQQPPTVATTK